MKHRFTPGPWSVDTRSHSEGVLISDATGVVIADVWYIAPDFDTVTPEVAQANARLIAQAPAMYALTRCAADSGTVLQGRAAQILRAIDGEPGKDAWGEPDARAAGFTGQEQAAETGAIYATWRGPAANFQNLPKVPHLPTDVAAALGATLATFRERGLDHLSTSNMVREVLGRYCNVID